MKINEMKERMSESEMERRMELIGEYNSEEEDKILEEIKKIK